MSWKLKKPSHRGPTSTIVDGTLPPEDEQRRIVHAVVRAVRASLPDVAMHHRVCGLYSMVLMTVLQEVLAPDYWFQAGYLRFGTGDPTTDEVAGVHPSCVRDHDGQGDIYHAWVARKHRHGRIEMIDVSLGFWPIMAESVGFTWQRPGFPSYLWTWMDEVRLGEGWDACYTPDRETMARLLRNFGTREPQEDVAHLAQNARTLLENPDMVLFGVGGEVPQDNPWGPMRTWG